MLLLFAGAAAADTIVSLPDISNADLTAEIQAMFGTSMTWTTAANVAEIDYWLSLVTSLGGDASLLEPPPEVVLPTDQASSSPVSAVTPLDLSPAQTSSMDDNPEPGTLVLLGGGLILLWGATASSLIRRRLNTS